MYFKCLLHTLLTLFIKIKHLAIMIVFFVYCILFLLVHQNKICNILGFSSYGMKLNCLLHALLTLIIKIKNLL